MPITMISINVQAGPISFNKHKHSASPDQLRSLLSSLSPSPPLSASLSLLASAEHQFKLLSNFTYKLLPAAKCLAIYGLLLIRLPFAALCPSLSLLPPLCPLPDLTILMAHVWLSSGGGTSLVA